MRLGRWVGAGIVLAAAGCVKGEGGRSAEASGGLPVSFDSSGTDVVAHVVGEVQPERVRRVTETWRLAVRENDTSLFSSVWTAEVDLAGRTWLLDAPTLRLFIVGPDGKVVRSVGRNGEGPGASRGTNGVVATRDSGLALWDPNNARISRFDGDGRLLGSVPTPGSFFTIDGLKLHPGGDFLITLLVGSHEEFAVGKGIGLVRLDSAGRMIDTLVLPVPDVPGVTYRGERQGARVVAGSRYAARAHWAWHPAGHVVTGDGGRYEIVVHRQRAKRVVIRRERRPVPLSSEERADDEAAITWQIRQSIPGWQFAGPPVPDTKAPLQELFVDRDGRIWAKVSTPSERIPDGELPLQGKGGAPAPRFWSSNVWEVFAPAGGFLGAVELPRKASIVQVVGEEIWFLDEDEDGLPALVRGRIELRHLSRMSP